ncbi:MAG: DinB family protein [Pyrinomonadaceae bacterium]|nr:DinB family protein [Pyrinomonadaceae bacterium]
MEQSDILREQLVKLLGWQDAHVNFDDAVEGISPQKQGVRPEGLPYSPWELLEHMRLTQRDILDFCRGPAYEAPQWPEGYWPKSSVPPTPQAWQESVAAFRVDRDALAWLAADPMLDLYAKIPHGEGQTYLREVLLVADHSAYHVGELVAVRRLLRIWR